MKIEHTDNGCMGSFQLLNDQTSVAEMTYSWSDDHIIIDHTFVDPSLRGKGVGEELIRHAIDFASRKHLKILPVCPYAKAIMYRKEEFLPYIYSDL